MSPGRRPSHFGAKPLHKIRPSSNAIAPSMTRNFPSSRTGKLLRDRASGNRQLRCRCAGRELSDAGAIQGLLRDARRFENGDGGRDPERLSQACAQIPSRRRQGQKAAEEKFKEINEAYEVLSDPEKRKKYEQLGADWNRPGGFQPPPQWEGQQPGDGFYQWGGDGGGVEFEFGGTGFSDFFETFFGGGRGRSAFGGFGGRPATAERGADVEADIMVP